MLAIWLDSFTAVLVALSVHLEKMANVLNAAYWGIYEICHNHLCEGCHILPIVAYTLDILCLHWFWVGNCVSN